MLKVMNSKHIHLTIKLEYRCDEFVYINIPIHQKVDYSRSSRVSLFMHEASFPLYIELVYLIYWYINVP